MKKTEKAKGKEQAAERKRRNLLYGIGGAVLIVIIALVLFFLLSQPVVKAGDTVSVYYVGTLVNGSVFDSNVNKTALTFTVGAHTVIPGFEDAVIGMSKGQVKTVNIPVDQAYGPYREDLVTTVNRSLFSSDNPPIVGMYYAVTNPGDGSITRIKVVSVSGDTVTIDQNHMLAGQNLTFVIRLSEISPKK